MSDLTEFSTRQAEERKRFIKEWNETNKPHSESEDSEDNSTQGVFLIDGSWYFGTEYANGYHPESLIKIPEFVCYAIRSSR